MAKPKYLSYEKVLAAYDRIGTMKGTAKFLGVTQSTISYHISGDAELLPSKTPGPKTRYHITTGSYDGDHRDKLLERLQAGVK